MTHEEVFLAYILEHRDEDAPRRVYADWLLDQHDLVQEARGEFIHLQCDLPGTPEGPPRAALLRRERQLLEAHGREWGSPFARLGCTCWEYRRGFVEGVGLPASAFVAQGALLFRLAPVHEVKLYQAAGVVMDLAQSPLLARVRTLDLEKNELGDGALVVLAGSAHLGEMATLLLWSNQIGDVGLHALLTAALPRLHRLDLSGNGIGDAGAEALADSPLLGRLTMLDLAGNQITDAGARALADSPHTAGLTWLELAKNPISQAGQNLLRERFAARVHVWG